jgi:hypothetical protein
MILTIGVVLLAIGLAMIFFRAQQRDASIHAFILRLRRLSRDDPGVHRLWCANHHNERLMAYQRDTSNQSFTPLWRAAAPQDERHQKPKLD